MIQINDLWFSYKQQPVYQQFNASVTEPGIYGVFGRNGSGKSTLLKLLSGLLSANKGSLNVSGFDPRQRKPAFLQQIYFLPEEFHLADLTTDKLAQTQAPFYPKFNFDLYRQYVDAFAIPTDKRFSTMSLGQKKKATIALALATLTPILLMDEPTNGLDITSRAQFKEFMSSAEQKQRITFISTHQAHDLERIMDHIWFIDEGKLLLSASLEVLNSALQMGVVNADTPPDEHSIYSEKIGQQTFWISPNTAAIPTEVNIEMLYKALSTNKIAILAAIDRYRAQVRENA